MRTIEYISLKTSIPMKMLKLIKLLGFMLIYIYSGNLYAQKNNLEGCWIEYKRTLLNDEEGNLYTFDAKPFKPEYQMEFNLDSNKVNFFDGKIVANCTFEIYSDTLIVEKHINMFNSIYKEKFKFIISEQSQGKFTLIECKSDLDRNFFVRKYYFQKQVNFKIPEKNMMLQSIISDKEPSFEGGKEGLSVFMKNNIIYPKKLRKQGITGKVYISLTINGKGEIINAEIMSNPRLEFAKEAMRVVRLMPKWVASTDGNSASISNFTLPVSFNLK